ncbi:MAG: threonine synthase [Clostridia bacterium]|nr:threonine synthase [Clostridia bacterium]
MAWNGVIEQYREYLPVTDDTPLVSLKEGGTPLIKARRISELVGAQVFLKFEGMNPTGSFKDRGMVMAVAKALEEKAQAVICASTGNTSASAAAYAASSGINCTVVIPEGNIALGKLAQALIYGAQVVSIQGSFDDALRIVRSITEKYPITLVNSLNPYRIEGQKTAAFEICDVLGASPDFLAIPVGNAGNITAYWKGFNEYHQCGKTDGKPKMLGFQASGAAPIVRGHVVENPETIATAIRIGNPASWDGAERAIKESQGLIDMVTDEEILEAYGILARTQGIFVEPASAASVAGLIKSKEKGLFSKDDTIVAVLTGHGLKDPDNAIKNIPEPISVPAHEQAVLDLIVG